MFRFLHPILLLLLFWQCHDESIITSSEAAAESIPFRQEFMLQAGDQIQLGGSTALDKLHLTLQSLNDSRCPANANCVHYGSATVMLVAKNSQGNTENLALCIGSCGSNPIRDNHTITTQAGNKTYKITLKEVQPFPGLELQGEAKKVVLMIEN